MGTATARRGSREDSHELYRRTLDQVTIGAGLPFVNWYEVLANEARSMRSESPLRVLSA